MRVPRRRFLAVAAACLAAPACKKHPTELRCDDVEGLTPQEITLRRETLAYVDHSPYPTKTCEGCQLYQPRGAESCGACTVLKGPVHPKGYCKSWIARSPL